MHDRTELYAFHTVHTDTATTANTSTTTSRLHYIGVRGVVLGDPCFQSDWVDCVYGRRLDIFNRTIELLNAMNAHNDVHYLQLLGDNFYDQEGSATHAWFQTLSLHSKSKLFGTVPGNHDYWINSSPEWYTQRDQLGNGFMQYYGIDTLAAGSGDAAPPFDFSVDPDDKQPGDPDRGTCLCASASACVSATRPVTLPVTRPHDDTTAGAWNLPKGENFFFYNQIGNTAFIGFSGAYAYDDMLPHFAEACAWAAGAPGVEVVLLQGHWHAEGTGCSEQSATSEV